MFALQDKGRLRGSRLNLHLLSRRRCAPVAKAHYVRRDWDRLANLTAGRATCGAKAGALAPCGGILGAPPAGQTQPVVRACEKNVQ